MLRLYDNKESRNGYKVVLLLTQLGVPFGWDENDAVDVDLEQYH